MKLKSVLVFSVVIASLAFVAIAGEKESEIAFKGEGYFCLDEQGRFIPCREEGDLLNVSHLGLYDVWYQIYPAGAPGGGFGPFKITGANGDSLEGYYHNFRLGPGTYTLDWTFTGDTGRFEGAEGTGHTDGLVDFSTLYAKFEFSGEVTVPEEED